MMQKPLEYWAVLVGMVLWAAARDAEREAIWRRLVKTSASGFLAFGLTPTVAPYLRGSETAAAVAIMAFGLAALDLMTALLADRAFIKDLIRARLGARDGGDNE